MAALACLTLVASAARGGLQPRVEVALEGRVEGTWSAAAETGRTLLFVLVRLDDDLVGLERIDLETGVPERLGSFEQEAVARLAPLRFGADAQPCLVVLLADQARSLCTLDAPQGQARLQTVLQYPAGAQVVVHPERPWLAVADVDRLTVHELTPRGVSARLPYSVQIPVDVDPLRHALELTSPPVHALPEKPGSPAGFAVGPQLLGNLRLRTQLVVPWAEEESEPYWATLPGLEHVETASFRWLGGRWVLAVHALRADKQGILERKKLRLFELKQDRTRFGARPFLAVLTASRMWQQLRADVGDYDGDGVDDLALLQAEGLGGGKLLVDVYRGEGKTLAKKSTRRVIKTSESWMRLGPDFTADGAPDLLVRSGGEVRVYSLQSTRRKTVLEEPTLRLEFPDAPRPDSADDDASPVRRARLEGDLLLLSSWYDDEDNRPVEVRLAVVSSGPASEAAAP